jgi:ubiquinone/menaquinone biosynthesis C-methylase UbiE
MTKHDHAHDHDPHAFEGPEEVARVVGDGEVALDLVAQVVDLLDDATAVRTVLDIGSGPGVATCELARLLPAAEILALDSSDSMVAAVGERAAALGVADRVSARVAELPEGVEGLRDVDLVWASMSLHHVSDEVAALRALRSTLSERGVVAILEFGGQHRQLPPVLGADLAERVDDAYVRFVEAQQQHWHGATPSGELADMVRAAGLRIVHDADAVITHEVPLSGPQRDHVTGSLQRARRQLGDFLDTADLTELQRQADDPDRPDTPVVVSRRVLVAVRP